MTPPKTRGSDMDVLCSCGGVNTLHDVVVPSCRLNIPFHGVSIPIVVSDVPATRCDKCGSVGVDGTADGVVRWALVEAGYLDVDEVHSHCLEQIRRVVASQ